MSENSPADQPVSDDSQHGHVNWPANDGGQLEQILNLHTESVPSERLGMILTVREAIHRYMHHLFNTTDIRRRRQKRDMIN